MELPFLWGAATSAHQVEGNNCASDWWAWEAALKVREASGAACDHYHLFPQDIELLSRLGHNAHRFSIEWSRLEPEEGVWNEEAFRHYEAVFHELRLRHIEPVVTLHHFTSPKWFMDRGGWLSDRALFYFSRYVERALEAFAPYVRLWVTINEPLIYLYFGYYEGTWPPGRRSYPEALAVLRRLLEAHLSAYRLIHGYYERKLGGRSVWVSIAHHMTHLTPCRPLSLLDQGTTAFRNYFFNHLCFRALQSGFLFLPGIFCEFLSSNQALDFLGVNYYTREFIRYQGTKGGEVFGASCEKGHHRHQVKETNAMGWEVYSEGFYHLLKSLARYQLPILITENGICSEEDTQRERFIRDHLAQAARAMGEGIPVRGYFYWSLLDNFEWAHGFGPRFGIVEVDYASQTRKIRKSAQVLQENCRNLMRTGSYS